MVLIKQKKISKLESHLPFSFLNKKIVIAVNETDLTQSKILKSGLNFPLDIGERVLPSSVGRVSRININGKETIRRDLPKETLYREMEFTRHQWCGKGQTEEVTDCVWIPYQRYQRDLELPFGIDVQVNKTSNGLIVISSDPILYSQSDSELLKHTINLYLELYGSCIAYEDGTAPIQSVAVRRLNWNVLPKGRQPWTVVKGLLTGNMLTQRPKTYAAVMDRFEKIHALNPDFLAYGSGGYKGYLVFGFESKGIYVLESQNTNNAIYIFDKDWEALSKLTKAEILGNQLQKVRIVHNPDWLTKLRQALV